MHLLLSFHSMPRFSCIFCLVIFLNSPLLVAQNADINLLRHINTHRNPSLDGTFKGLSNSVVPLTIGVPVILTGVGLVRKDKHLVHNGLETGASLGIATILTFTTKYAVQRQRPYVRYPDIQPVVTSPDPSFPSGHTSSAFSTATSVSVMYKKWYIVVPAYAWAGSVGYSRMHLGVHYPTDVLVGAVTGAGSALLAHKLRKWLKIDKGF